LYDSAVIFGVVVVAVGFLPQVLSDVSDGRRDIILIGMHTGKFKKS
jgi:hypothetical protein